jgi:putative PIN family toxin of toxin-antitoxin system
LEEFVEVAKRPKFKKYFSEEDLKGLLNTIDHYAQIIEVKSDLHLCKDKKDDFLLSLAVDGSADFLITGDSDLLELKSIHKTQIIKISDYLNIY